MWQQNLAHSFILSYSDIHAEEQNIFPKVAGLMSELWNILFFNSPTYVIFYISVRQKKIYSKILASKLSFGLLSQMQEKIYKIQNFPQSDGTKYYFHSSY